MRVKKSKQAQSLSTHLRKCPTGINGLDEITNGGLPKGRASLLVGESGTGKTFIAIEFLVRGIKQYNEPGLFISLEETENDLIKNFSSIDFDLKSLVDQNKIILDHIQINRIESRESGQYNLDGLFIRINQAIKKYKIKRIVIDSLDILFSHFDQQVIIRAELERLFEWLKSKNITSIVIAEKGVNSLTRHGFEEYVADCVVFLDRRVAEQLSVRRLRIVKYRGSAHGANEYPFLLTNEGAYVLPITSMKLDYMVSKEFISSGIKNLDVMLNGKGYYKASAILITGAAGIGKSSYIASFVREVCAQKNKCLFFSFEESPDQIIRNMTSIGIHLGKYIKKGNLLIHSMYPYSNGLEDHLLNMINLIDKFKPVAVVVDPFSNLKTISRPLDVKLMITKLANHLKRQRITGLFSCLLQEGGQANMVEQLSSVMDTWINLKYIERDGKRYRILIVLKSRGMQHTTLLQEFKITNEGIIFSDPHINEEGPFSGSVHTRQIFNVEIEKRDEVENTSPVLSNSNSARHKVNSNNGPKGNVRRRNKIKKIRRKKGLL